MTVSDSPRPSWQADAATVLEALHTLTSVSHGEAVDDGALHEDSLNGYAALERLVARLTQLESALTSARPDIGTLKKELGSLDA